MASYLSVHVVAFSPTSSPELDDVLTTIRNKILLPSYLPQDQRKQLFSPKHEQKLRQNPITMEIDSEVLRFGHMDLMKDLPNTRKLLYDAVGRMQTREDFENLPRLLEGLHSAGRRLQTRDYVRIARIAAERGCLYTVIESARMARRTGMRLDASEKVAEILAYVQLKAIDASSKGDKAAVAASDKALLWSEMVVDLLQGDLHGRRIPQGQKDDRFPLHLDPQVLAAPLHMAAQVATQAHGGKDLDGKVAKYAKDVVSLWPAGKGLLELHPAQHYDRLGEMHYLTEKNKFVFIAAPLLKGMDLAMEIVSPELAAELKLRRDALATEVEEALKHVRDDPHVKGRAVYNKLFNPEAAAPAAE